MNKNINIGKYEFESKEVFDKKMRYLHYEDKDGNIIPKKEFAVVELGHIITTEGEYDEDDEEIVAPVFSSEYHVDVIWFLPDEYEEDGSIAPRDHPWGWKGRNNDINNEGMHSFAGISYLDNKFKK